MLRTCLVAVVVAQLLVQSVAACPFCTAVGPSFAERRAECDALVVGESDKDKTFRVHQVLKGREALGDVDRVTAETDAASRPGDLALLVGKRGDGWSWDVVPVDESSLAYFARLPDLARPWSDRLRYCAKFLEHADPQVAEDAFREFARAPFDDVAAAAEAFDYPRVRAWLVDPTIPDERKGFYGLVLGLSRDDAVRAENVTLLRKLVATPASEFRAGFDGVLGGLLWAEGATALDFFDKQLLANPDAAEGDVRHAQSALRVYQQYGKAIPAERLKRSLALLLDRPGTATGAIQDFTRRQDWDYVDRCERLFVASPGDDAVLDRAVVGYLLLCPKAEATAALRRLREAAPERVANAERYLALVGVRGSS